MCLGSLGSSFLLSDGLRDCRCQQRHKSMYSITLGTIVSSIRTTCKNIHYFESQKPYKAGPTVTPGIKNYGVITLNNTK